MSLRIRRGTNAQRTSITFDLGEIVYTTDTQKLYIGDGVTAGGKNLLETSAGNGFTFNPTTQQIDFAIGNLNLNTAQVSEDASRLYFTTERAQDAVGAALVAGNTFNTGITFTYDDANNRITAVSTGGLTTVSSDTNPSLGGNLSIGAFNISGNGSITASTITATTGLGANLPLNGKTINGTGNINITGNITGSSDINGGKLILNKTLDDSGILIETNVGGDGVGQGGITINSYHNETFPTSMRIARSRGTFTSPTALSNGDNIFAFAFLGRTPGNIIVPAGSIGVQVDGTISAGVLPGKVVIWTTNAAGDFTQKLAIGPDGLQTIVAPALVAGASSGQVNTGTISSWMKVSFNGANYAVPMYAIRP
jgi:hypothetical protein